MRFVVVFFPFLSLSLFFCLRGGQTPTGAGLLHSTSAQIPQWNLCRASRPQTLRHFIIWHCLTCLNHILRIMLTPRIPGSQHVRRQETVEMNVRSSAPLPLLQTPPSRSLYSLPASDKWMPVLWRCSRYVLRCKSGPLKKKKREKEKKKRRRAGSPHRATETREVE